MENFWDIFDNIDLKTVGKVVSMANPMAGGVIATIGLIVDSKNESISNDSVIKTIKAMEPSKGNSLNSEKIAQIEAILRG